MSNSELDLEGLLKEFDLPDVHTQNANLPAPLPIPKDAEPGDVEDITRHNVARANRFLDMMERELVAGWKYDAKTMEAASKLIDSISTASEILSSIELTEKTLDFKERSLDLRKYEFDAKMQQKLDKGEVPEHLTQNMNFFVGSREDVMDLIRETTNKQPQSMRLVQDIENATKDEFDNQEE